MLLLSPLGQDTRVSGHTTPLRRTDTQSISHRLPAPSLIGIVVTIARRRTDDGRRASPPGRADTNTLSPSRTQTSSAVRSSGAQPLRPHSLGTISAPPALFKLPACVLRITRCDPSNPPVRHLIVCCPDAPCVRCAAVAGASAPGSLARPVSASARDVAQPSPTEQLSCLRAVAHVLRHNAQLPWFCLAWKHHQLWLWRNSSRPFRLLSLSPLVLCRAQPTEDGLFGMDDVTQPAWVESVRRMVTEHGAHPWEVLDLPER